MFSLIYIVILLTFLLEEVFGEELGRQVWQWLSWANTVFRNASLIDRRFFPWDSLSDWLILFHCKCSYTVSLVQRNLSFILILVKIANFTFFRELSVMELMVVAARRTEHKVFHCLRTFIFIINTKLYLLAIILRVWITGKLRNAGSSK